MKQKPWWKRWIGLGLFFIVVAMFDGLFYLYLAIICLIIGFALKYNI